MTSLLTTSGEISQAMAPQGDGHGNYPPGMPASHVPTPTDQPTSSTPATTDGSAGPVSGDGHAQTVILDASAAAALPVGPPVPGEVVDVTSVPATYFDCNISDLAMMVATMLEEIIALNDALPFNSEKLTRFHSRAPPSISVRDYLFRIVKFCTLNKSILVVVLYFIDLLSGAYSNFVVNSLTVHRFIITSIVVASKGLCDAFCANAHCAKVGGISQIELNLLEAEFLTRVEFRILPNAELLAKYYDSIIQRHPLPKFKALSTSPNVRYPDTGDYSQIDYRPLLQAAEQLNPAAASPQNDAEMQSIHTQPLPSQSQQQHQQPQPGPEVTQSSTEPAADETASVNGVKNNESQLFKKFGVKSMRRLWSSAGQHRKRPENERDDNAVAMKRSRP